MAFINPLQKYKFKNSIVKIIIIKKIIIAREAVVF